MECRSALDPVQFMRQPGLVRVSFSHHTHTTARKIHVSFRCVLRAAAACFIRLYPHRTSGVLLLPVLDNCL
jgi:hypothetical protein